MAPIHTVAPTATSAYGLSSRAHNRVGITVARMMITPPIVGVPRLPWCDAGPSARTTWPTPRSRNVRMMSGPTKKPSSSAVTVAPAARNVM
jgi:hypothetical protein